MSFIIDRRLNSKKKSTVNRQRFLKRYRKQIKKAVEDSLNKRSIKDLQQGENITIDRDSTAEPYFQHGRGGTQTRVYPGNKEFVTGDEFPRPPAGGGSGNSGSGDASDQGIGEDEFTFHINQDEFLDFMFEGLELPNLIKKQLKSTTSFESHQAGFTSHSSPDRLHLTRSLRIAYARRIALSGSTSKELSALKKRLWLLEADPVDEQQALELGQLKQKIASLLEN